MQISLHLNLIINEVSDSQLPLPHQKLADTSVRRPRLASAGAHAKPRPPACLWSLLGVLGAEVPTAGRAPTSADPTAQRE